MNEGKAITFDGYSDKWIKTTKRWDLLNMFWNQQFINSAPKLGEARLILLNKVWPNIPK